MFKFENVGQAIKNIAKWAFIIEAIGCVIAGIGMLIAEGTDYIIAALLLICLGPFVAYASVLVLYGFGILVERAEESQRHSSEQKKTALCYSNLLKKSFPTENIPPILRDGFAIIAVK